MEGRKLAAHVAQALLPAGSRLISTLLQRIARGPGSPRRVSAQQTRASAPRRGDESLCSSQYLWPNPGKTPRPQLTTWPIAIFLSLCLCVSVVNPVFAADKEHLAMLANAQAAFDRVAGTTVPPLADASACLQTQAAMLSVALPGEESELHYRKGFCELAV